MMGKDTDCLIDSNEKDEEECGSKKPQQQQRKSRNIFKKLLPDHLKKYWRTILLVFFLFFAGIFFLIMALYIISLPDAINGPHSYVFILCGVVCIVPGGYHVFYLYFALSGKEGYKVEELPTFGEEE